MMQLQYVFSQFMQINHSISELISPALAVGSSSPHMPQKTSSCIPLANSAQSLGGELWSTGKPVSSTLYYSTNSTSYAVQITYIVRNKKQSWALTNLCHNNDNATGAWVKHLHCSLNEGMPFCTYIYLQLCASPHLL